MIKTAYLHILVSIALLAVFTLEVFANNDLKLLQKFGHRPIILLGGNTTLIGDPSKDSTRKILNQKQINRNIKSIKKVFGKI